MDLASIHAVYWLEMQQNFINCCYIPASQPNGWAEIELDIGVSTNKNKTVIVNR